MAIKGLEILKNLLFLSLIGLIVAPFTIEPVPVDADFEICETQNTTFESGEVIEYELYYNWGLIWIPAGTVTFVVNETGPFVEIKAIGTSFPSYDSFYKVRDTFYTKLDKETMLPVEFYRDIQEGKYELYSHTRFDQESHTATSKVDKRGRIRNYQFEYDNCMHDLLSILYYFRNIDFESMKKDVSLPANFLLDSKIYNLSVQYKGVESRKKVKGMGRFRAMHFSLGLIAGHVFNEGDELKAWVTDDKNKIALLVESPVSVGSVKAVLSGYKGLKHEITSKVK